MNGFALKNGKMVNGCTLPMASENSHGHSHAPNGYVIHPINITSNPLATDAKVCFFNYVQIIIKMKDFILYLECHRNILLGQS